MVQEDYYEILGVEKNDGAKKIKNAYRELAYKYHPDKNSGNPESVEKMKKVNEAYAVLSNPDKRKEYDSLQNRFGSSAHTQFRQNYTDQDIFNGSDVNQILDEMAKSFGFRGVDEIFNEFYGQGYQTFEFKRPGFFGGGFFFTGQFSGKGLPNKMKLPESGNLGKLSGFLLKQLAGAHMPQNGKDMNDLIHLYPDHAKEGGPYAYSHKKKSKKLVVKIPPNVRQGQKIRLAGMGMEGKKGGKHGDLYLKVDIRKSLVDKCRDLIGNVFNSPEF